MVQVENAFCFKIVLRYHSLNKLFELFANSRPLALNFKSFSRSLEQFFLTVGQNNFGNKIPFFQTTLITRLSRLQTVRNA